MTPIECFAEVVGLPAALLDFAIFAGIIIVGLPLFGLLSEWHWRWAFRKLDRY